MYCRGFGQVPPSGPTGCSVVTSFPRIPNWDQEEKSDLEQVVLKGGEV
jgi:hypothetical protein